MKTKTQQADDEKFKELILFICARSEGDPKFGATKLNKLLFYADFLFYLEHGKSITGHRYQKLEFGPAPKALLPILAQMKEAGEVATAERDHFGRKQTVTFALRDADLSRFSSKEVDLVNHVISECWNTNAKAISRLSHTFIGWKAAKMKEDIPYQTALLVDDDDIEVTEAIRATGASLEQIAKKCLARR